MTLSRTGSAQSRTDSAPVNRLAHVYDSIYELQLIRCGTQDLSFDCGSPRLRLTSTAVIQKHICRTRCQMSVPEHHPPLPCTAWRHSWQYVGLPGVN